MWDDPGLVDVLRIEPLLDALAAKEPAPGGGSAAALVGAMAAALCAKVARFSGDDGAVA
ncbi:MAG: Formiminotransferase-cyclodeaminase, partial [Gaiellaceae bacterium]|nr:Formiminotransferase-cyclodeaminase [Gaiellaceae bacterium]